jgi:hypothetical protein
LGGETREVTMRSFFCTALAVSAMALAAPINALAQAVTSFDGTYAGVSLTTSGNGHSCAAASPVPGPLTISDGNAHTHIRNRPCSTERSTGKVR